jgi:hypothetical protein
VMSGAGSGGYRAPSAGSAGQSLPTAGSGGMGAPSAGSGGQPLPSAGSGGQPLPSAGSGGVSNGGTGGVASCYGIAGSDVANPGAGYCSMPALHVAARSDTNQSWDDNDFSDVTLCGNACTTMASVNWPHEANWANADPAEANHEVTYFTLDWNNSIDLTNKKLVLSLFLWQDESLGQPWYDVSLISVSTYDRPIAAGGSAGAASTEIGYAEVELPAAKWGKIRYTQSSISIQFTLPQKTSAIDSYDPQRVIKNSIRIYSGFERTSGSAGAGGTGGIGAGGIGAGGTGGDGYSTGGIVSAGYGGAPTFDYGKAIFRIQYFGIGDANMGGSAGAGSVGAGAWHF